MITDETSRNFKNINGFDSIATFFCIPKAELWDILMNKKEEQYEVFEVPKKDSSTRRIFSPKPRLKYIQKQLADVLNETYNVYPMAMGFVKERDLVKGAKYHVKQQSILSIDLKDFFPSIKFGRVRAMFSSYYKFNLSDASTLASICCLSSGELPQGSPVSPIISNIICHKLDQQINRLCRKNKCVYTRYADDITISSQQLDFPQQLAKKVSGGVEIGMVLKNIISCNGFYIQDKKTRLKNKHQSLTVTGIKVNQKLNVNRNYIRRIRSILNTIEKNDLEKAKELFESKYQNRKHQKSTNMFMSLRGMIAFAGHVKGRDDVVFNKLAKRYNELGKKYSLRSIIRIPTFDELKKEAVFPIFGGDSDWIYYKFEQDDVLFKEDATLDNGTGFYLHGIGIITSAHLYLELKKAINAYGIENLIFENEYYITLQKNNGETMKAKIAKIDFEKDIAILTPNELLEVSFKYCQSYSEGDEVKVLGFPSYQLGNTIRIDGGSIGGTRMNRKTSNFELLGTIIHGGNSGGPIVNNKNEVIGIAAKGLTGSGNVPNEVIPIKHIFDL